MKSLLFILVIICNLDQARANRFCEQPLRRDRLVQIQIDNSLNAKLDHAADNATLESFHRQPSNHLKNIEKVLRAIQSKLKSNIEFKQLKFYYFDEDRFPGYSNYQAVYCTNLFSDESLTLFISRGFFDFSNTIFDFVSHEYFHWLVDKYQLKFPHWLEEGAAQLFQTMVLNKVSGELQQFHLDHSPGLALDADVTKLMGDPDLIKSFYGNALLFLEYLAGRRPSAFVKSLLSSSPESSYKEVVERAFAATGNNAGLSFAELFHNYSIAKYYNTYNFSKMYSYEARKWFLGDSYLVATPNPNCKGQELNQGSCLLGGTYSSSLIDSSLETADIVFHVLPLDHPNQFHGPKRFIKSFR